MELLLDLILAIKSYLSLGEDDSSFALISERKSYRGESPLQLSSVTTFIATNKSSKTSIFASGPIVLFLNRNKCNVNNEFIFRVIEAYLSLSKEDSFSTSLSEWKLHSCGDLRVSPLHTS